MLHGGGIAHDDYWSSFGFPIYDPSRVGSVVCEPMETPSLEAISYDGSQPYTSEDRADLDQQKMEFHEVFEQLGLSSSRANLVGHFQTSPLTSIADFCDDWSSKEAFFLLVYGSLVCPHLGQDLSSFSQVYLSHSFFILLLVFLTFLGSLVEGLI